MVTADFRAVILCSLVFSVAGDYEAMSGVMVMFSVGTAQNSVQRQIFITINDDTILEDDESFRVTFEPMDTSLNDTTNFAFGNITETIITIRGQTGKGMTIQLE